jgi:hypothetical protein
MSKSRKCKRELSRRNKALKSLGLSQNHGSVNESILEGMKP